MKNFLLHFLCGVQLAVAGCLASTGAKAQEMSLSTNVVDYASTGSVNLEAAYGFARHWSMSAGMKFGNGGRNRQQLYSVGSRFWPWHIYSGWWLGAKMQYQEFNEEESVTSLTSEGDRFGTGFAAGYSKMLGKHFNLDLGVGLWTGYSKFVTYACPNCGRIVDGGKSVFLLPNDITIAVSYIF